MRIVIFVACLCAVTSSLHAKIVFSSNRDGNFNIHMDWHGDFEIYTMESDGSNQTRLTFNRTDDFSPAWSPNGKQIVFTSYRDGDQRPEIYVMDADGSNQLRLTHHPGWDVDPDWSPDGNQIAFSSDRHGDPNKFGIFVMDTDGSNVRHVRDFGISPKWSPDGKWILFRSGDIYAIRPDGTDLWRVVEQKPDIDIHLGGWSPDGKRIVYKETLHNSVNNTTIFMATLHFAGRLKVIGRTQVKIPRIKAVFGSPSFSADGKAILFRGKKDFVKAGVKGDPWDIYRFRLADKQLIQLTDNPGTDGAPQEWNPRLPVSPQELTPTLWGEIKTTR